MRIDEQQKAIVKAVMRDSTDREKRRLRGEQTQFDAAATDAVLSARRDLRIPGMDAETRKVVINKICESLEKTIPWELIGNTYMGRRQFYQLRSEFIYLVARNMGMVDPQNAWDPRHLKQSAVTSRQQCLDRYGRNYLGERK